MQGVSDPIGTGLVASLARPGANVTGTSAMSTEVVGKSLELLRGMLPSVSRVAVLWNPDNAIFQAQMLRETQIVAGTLGLELQPFGARTSNEIDQAFVAMTGARVGALLVLADPVLSFNRTRIAELAAKDHLPAVYGSRDYVVAGGLMSYGPGRVHVRGPGAVPTVREDLYEKVVATINGTGPAATDTWDAIKPGHLVIAHESLRDGWWEAIVVERTGDKVTLRWREYAGQTALRLRR